MSACVRAAAAARTHADIASFRFTQAVELLLAVYARTGDSAYLAPARAVLDYLVDSGDAGLAASARDEPPERSEEHTSELQSRLHLVCRLLLEKKKKIRHK